MEINKSIMRVFKARAREGHAQELEKKLTSTSISVVLGKPGNMGYFSGKQPSSDHEFVFISIWDSLESVKSYFGEDWESSYLPPGYAEIIDEHSIEHFEFDGIIESGE